ncbi:MAG: alpha/beta fold hydrolase [Dehalococcoidia bacterium]
MNPVFENRWITAGGIKTHCLVGGEGPPLVLIHGIGASTAADEWRNNLQSLGLHHRVYAPDLAGHGKSAKPGIDYSIGFFTTFFDNLMNALELERASLIGHSLGGGIALDFAVNQPHRVEKLVLVDSAGLSEKLGLAGRVLFPLFTGIARLRRDHVYLSLMRGGNNGKPVQVYMDRLHEIRSPTLIAWGEWDGYLPVKLAYEAHERLQSSRLHIFKRCWHAPQKQRASEFNRIVSDFLLSQDTPEDENTS